MTGEFDGQPLLANLRSRRRRRRATTRWGGKRSRPRRRWQSRGGLLELRRSWAATATTGFRAR